MHLGCLDESVIDGDGPYHIIQNYNQNFLHSATHHVVSDGATNKVRFSFVVPDTIIRDTIYVHAQITLSLIETDAMNAGIENENIDQGGRRRRRIRRVLLDISEEHKPNKMSNPDPEQFAENEDDVTNMDQIRHFGGSSGVIQKIFGDEELRRDWNKKLLIVSSIVFVVMLLMGFIGLKIHKSDPINWGMISDLIEQRRLRRLERLRMIGGDKRAYYGPVKHNDSELESGMECQWKDEYGDDQDLLMSHDDGCNDHM